jgi:hypothetical protein
VQLLLTSGVSISQLNNDSQKALDLARDFEIAEIIREAMSNSLGEQARYWSDEEEPVQEQWDSEEEEEEAKDQAVE